MLAVGRVIFRRSNAVHESLRRIEQSIGHAERSEDSLSRQLIHRFPGHASENFPKENKTQVRINRLRAWFVFERLVANIGDRFSLGMYREEIVFVRGKTRGVREQVTNRDAFAPFGIGTRIPFGKVSSDGQVERDAA